MKRVILIDYENTQRIDFEQINTEGTEIIIFLGKSQNKIPFPIVEKVQTLGKSVRWLKIAGDGKNNLDFHLAFELGRLCEGIGEDAEFIILSKDSGYDALIAYIIENGLNVKRIANLAELSDGMKEPPSSTFTGYIVANLSKIAPERRPRTRSTLKKHMESVLRERASANEIDSIIEEMFIKGLLTETGKRLKYNLP